MTNHYVTQCFSTHLSTFVSSYSYIPSEVIDTTLTQSNKENDTEINTYWSNDPYLNDSSISITNISR